MSLAVGGDLHHPQAVNPEYLNFCTGYGLSRFNGLHKNIMGTVVSGFNDQPQIGDQNKALISTDNDAVFIDGMNAQEKQSFAVGRIFKQQAFGIGILFKIRRKIKSGKLRFARITFRQSDFLAECFANAILVDARLCKIIAPALTDKIADIFGKHPSDFIFNFFGA